MKFWWITCIKKACANSTILLSTLCFTKVRYRYSYIDGLRVIFSGEIYCKVVFKVRNLKMCDILTDPYYLTISMVKWYKLMTWSRAVNIIYVAANFLRGLNFKLSQTNFWGISIFRYDNYHKTTIRAYHFQNGPKFMNSYALKISSHTVRLCNKAMFLMI